MADAKAKRDGYGTFANKIREEAREQASARLILEAQAEADKAQKRQRAEEDPEYGGKVKTWQARLARQKAKFARSAPKPMSMSLTCTFCGKQSSTVSWQEVEAWDCHVKCGGRKANGV